FRRRFARAPVAEQKRPLAGRAKPCGQPRLASRLPRHPSGSGELLSDLACDRAGALELRARERDPSDDWVSAAAVARADRADVRVEVAPRPGIVPDRDFRAALQK